MSLSPILSPQDPHRVVVYGGDLLVPETRLGWPEMLMEILCARRPKRSPRVLNLGLRGAQRGVGFADVVRRAAGDQRSLHGTVAVLALSHTDGRSDRLAPAEAARFVALGVEHLLVRGAERVVVVGPTGGGSVPGKRQPTGYGHYARWLKRTDRAVLDAVGEVGGASYVSLAGLPVDLTRDGIHPQPAGWRWVAERVADALVGAP